MKIFSAAAPQRINHAVFVLWSHQDIPGLGTLAWPDDAAAFQQVHQPAWVDLRAGAMSATAAAQCARTEVCHPEWMVERLDSGWLVARRGTEEVVVLTIPDLGLRMNEKPRRTRGGGETR